jgi:hypothetical protein
VEQRGVGRLVGRQSFVRARRDVPWKGIGGGRLGGRQFEQRVLREDRRLDGPQPRTGIGPELLRQHAASALRGGECVALAAAAVERQHEQPPPLLLQRIAGEPLLQLGNDLGVIAERQAGLEQRGHGTGPHLHEPPALGVGEGRVRPVRVRLAPPEVERGGQRPHRRGGVPGGEQRPAARNQIGEPQRVDVVAVRRQRVARPAPQDVAPGRAARAVRLEGAAQMDQVDQQRTAGARRAVAVPQRLDDAIGTHDVRRVRREDGQQKALLGPRHRHRITGVASDLQRSEDRDAHPPTLVPPGTEETPSGRARSTREGTGTHRPWVGSARLASVR